MIFQWLTKERNIRRFVIPMVFQQCCEKDCQRYDALQAAYEVGGDIAVLEIQMAFNTIEYF